MSPEVALSWDPRKLVSGTLWDPPSGRVVPHPTLQSVDPGGIHPHTHRHILYTHTVTDTVDSVTHRTVDSAQRDRAG